LYLALIDLVAPSGELFLAVRGYGAALIIRFYESALRMHGAHPVLAGDGRQEEERGGDCTQEFIAGSRAPL